MKLYDAIGPHPSVVRMFIAEKGVEIPAEILVLGIGHGRNAAHLARNPMGEAPVLETDEGHHISEIVAICEYLEELFPEPCLIGTTPLERAETRMWARRVDLHVCVPLYAGYRSNTQGLLRASNGLPVPRDVEEPRLMASIALDWVDQQLHGRDYLCGDRFSFADIMLYCFLIFGETSGQFLEPDWTALAAWRERVAARPSAESAGQVRVAPQSLGGTV